MSPHRIALLRRLLPLVVLPALLATAWADENPRRLAEPANPQLPFKLTAGWYDFSNGSRGQDVNLRYGADFGNLWVGNFRLADQDVNQWRAGWDSTLGTSVRISPSVQIASGGFAGGSLAVETGQPWFVGAGFGRTNLHPYWNLNFDPNDSYSLAFGHRDDSGQLLALQLVRDDRQNPDQRHVHFLYRQPLPAGERLTVDVLHKDGRVEGTMIHRWGLSLTYDWPRFFVRLAYDPKTNFGPVDVSRLTVGTRF